jgi:hypothetical protein
VSPSMTRGSRMLGIRSALQGASQPSSAYHGTELTGASHSRTQHVDGQHPAVGVAGAVQPDQFGGLRPLRRVVRGQGVGAGHGRTDGVCGVCRERVHDGVALAQADHERQQGHQLLRADGGQHVLLGQPVNPAPSGVPVDDGALQGGGADRLRVGMRVRRRRQGGLDDGRGGVHRRADRQVDDAVGVGPGLLRERQHRIPRIVG